MGFRSLFAGVLAAGVMIAGGASAQALLCPTPPTLDADKTDMHAEAATLLERLSIALDLHGRAGFDEAAISQFYRDMPGVLLAKLGNIADRCALAATYDLASFHRRLPALRRAFLAATSTAGATGLQPSDADSQTDNLDIRVAADLSKDTVPLKQSIDLSIRELWRKLWFRSALTADGQVDRWAVIVASPANVGEGWDLLAEHQEQWTDVYFQLHQPYYDDNRHHAIIVGKKMGQEEAERLSAYVKELGMADDSYIWPVPVDEAVSFDSTESKIAQPEGELVKKSLDLSILSNF